jgi:hypothetical protein
LAVLLFWLLGPWFRAAGGGVPAEPPEDFAYGEGTGKENALRSELAGLKARYKETLMACGPEQPPPAPAPLPAEEPPPALPEPEGREAAPPPSASVAPQALEAAPPPPPKPKDGDELAIPEDATDLAFLEGCWKSDAGIYNTVTGVPIYVYYCFSSGGGKASVRVDELNSRGGKIRSCNGSANATLSGGKVRIRAGRIRCGGTGRVYVPSTINCSPSSGGAARCTLQSDGGRRLDTKITRQGS